MHLVQNLDYRLHKALWFLESASEYISAIEDFISDMKSVEYLSRALDLLIKHVDRIRASSLFANMKRHQKELKERLGKFVFSIYMKQSRVEIYPCGNLSDVKSVAEKLFSFLDFKEVQVEDPEVFVLSGTSRLESEILEKAFKFSKDLSKKLHDFYIEFYEFFDDKLKRFVHEFPYYIKLRKFFKNLSKHYPVSIPELSDDKTGCFENFYNVTLAVKLRGSGIKVVTNDLRIESDERLFVITGSNQGGKTTYAKAIGQIMHLIRVGSYVPASFARGWVISKLLMHFEERENVKEDRSMLEKEMYI